MRRTAIAATTYLGMAQPVGMTQRCRLKYEGERNITQENFRHRAPVWMPVKTRSEDELKHACQRQQSDDKNDGDDPQNYFHFISLT